MQHSLAVSFRRADFKDMLMHDLGNGLDTLLVCAESLMDQPDPGDASTLGLLQTLRSGTELMRHLLNEYYRQSGLVKEPALVSGPMAINPTLKKIGKLFEPLARHRDVQIQYRLEEPLAPITADALALQRIFMNLVHNALRFTSPKGLVTLASHCQGRYVVASVLDTGVGMAPDWKSAPRGPGRAGQRTHRGIGLLIVEQLVHTLGGDLDVGSIPGQGTSCRLYFPVVRQLASSKFS